MRVKVWDLPTRVFHWLFAGTVLAQFATAWLGGDAMFWHVRLGYAALALVIFRLYWGFFGSETARFRHFLRPPPEVIAYARALIRRQPPEVPGHNPMGGWAVLAMLLAVGAQALLGMFSNDDIMIEGPLYGLVDKSTSDALTGWHKTGAVVIMILVGLHLAAIATHEWLFRERLVPAMVHGAKPLQQPVTVKLVPVWRAIPGVMLAVAVVWALVRWGMAHAPTYVY